MPESEGPRPPLRTERILAALDRHGVEYVLIGGLAAVAHGSAIPTTDLDLVPEASRPNLARLAAALGELDAKLRVPDLAYPLDVALDDHSFDAFTTAAFRTPHGDVDVVLRPDAPGPGRYFTYAELNERAQNREAFGVTIRVADLGDIMASKAAAGRPQDLAALPHLSALRTAVAEVEVSPEAAQDIESPPPAGSGRLDLGP
jgi:hypothetical protein